MKTLTKLPTFFLAILSVFFLFSCEQEAETESDMVLESEIAKENECPNPSFEIKTFEEENNYDILLVAAPIENATSYVWEVTTGSEKQTFEKDSNTLGWGPKEGDTTFCLSVITSDCSGSEKVCQTFTRNRMLDEDAEVCPAIELTVNNGLPVKQVNFSEVSEARITKIPGAVSYEWTVNGVETEDFEFDFDDFKIDERLLSGPTGKTAREIIETLENSLTIRFDRFEDAEICVTVVTDACKEGVTVCKDYKKSPPVDYCAIPDYLIDLSKDLSNMIVTLRNFSGNPNFKVWTAILTTADGVSKEFEIRNGTIFNLELGIYEICANPIPVTCPEGTSICKKIELTQEILDQIKEEAKDDTLGHIRIKLKEKEAGLYIPIYAK
ncbi:hypothetical protein [Aquimarina agarivorans]|uniref:hypothetical protein n=1 Tax=Aquimarina agarivorans TaxID=980584 RepID=UPI000248FDB9|nr:hypothetical protein [Aquimarina agarivorans]